MELTHLVGAFLKRLVIPVLSAIGGALAMLYPAHLSALCGSVL